jgi:hypothetical protein
LAAIIGVQVPDLPGEPGSAAMRAAMDDETTAGSVGEVDEQHHVAVGSGTGHGLTEGTEVGVVFAVRRPTKMSGYDPIGRGSSPELEATQPQLAEVLAY